MTASEDREHLDLMTSEVHELLWDLKRVATTSNIIQALCELHYIDWLGGDEIHPTCEMEGPSSGT